VGDGRGAAGGGAPGDRVRVRGDHAGAHVLVELPDPATERAVLATAARHGVLLDGLTRHFAGPPTAAGVVLGYAAPTRAELERALPIVTAALAGSTVRARDGRQRGHAPTEPR
jgi:GntR family transcriptional regulator/MocR family aminotransferase